MQRKSSWTHLGQILNKQTQPRQAKASKLNSSARVQEAVDTKTRHLQTRIKRRTTTLVNAVCNSLIAQPSPKRTSKTAKPSKRRSLLVSTPRAAIKVKMLSSLSVASLVSRSPSCRRATKKNQRILRLTFWTMMIIRETVRRLTKGTQMDSIKIRHRIPITSLAEIVDQAHSCIWPLNSQKKWLMKMSSKRRIPFIKCNLVAFSSMMM